MKKLIAIASLLIVPIVSCATCEIQSVTAQQRYPWNGLVDIVVTFAGESNDVAAAQCFFAATNGETQACIPIEHIAGNLGAFGFGNVWNRKFIWDANSDVGAQKIDCVKLTVGTKISFGGVQLWKDGPYWSECNVGATKPEESGYYFWWGDTIGYAQINGQWCAVDGSRIGISFDSGICSTYGKSESALRSSGYIDSSGHLAAKYDAATENRGVPWRIPTDVDFSELICNCETEWTTLNGVRGRIFKGKGVYSSKAIFLPAAAYVYGSELQSFGWAGWYWTSVRLGSDNDDARCLSFSSDSVRMDGNFRYVGQPIRSIRDVGGVNGPSVTSPFFALDCRVDARVVSLAGEELEYDAKWYDAGDTVKIVDNGECIASGEFGRCHWMPKDELNHHLVMTVFDCNGAMIAEESAHFTFIPSDGEVVIPNGWTEIPASLFEDCNWLVSVTIPSSVKIVGANAFNGCDSLVRVDVSSVADWLNISFENGRANPLHTGAALSVAGVELVDIVIPNKTTEIGDYAFFHSSLSTVTIPNSVKRIGKDAFKDCSKLRTVGVYLGDGARIASLYDFGSGVNVVDYITMDQITLPYPVSSLPIPTVRDNVKNSILLFGVDYAIDSSKSSIPSGVGTGWLLILMKNGYEGEFRFPFSVIAKDISGADITLGDKLTYNGKEQTQDVLAVKIDGLDATYTVSGNTATSAGEHELTITGTGNFTGTAVRKYSIGRKDIAGASVNLGAALVYSGEEQEQLVESVTVDGLAATFALTNNRGAEAGEYTLTANGTGNFCGYVESKFVIARKDVSDAVVTLGDALTYNGKEQTQTVRGVKVGGLDVTYTVSGNAATSAGEHALTVVGTGNFTGTAVRKYTIGQKDINNGIADLSIKIGIDKIEWDGKEHAIPITLIGCDGVPVSYDVSIAGGKSLVEVGEYVASVRGKGDYCGVFSVEFKIYPKDITEAVIVLGPSLTYNGKTQTQTIKSVTVDGLAVTYTVSGGSVLTAGEHQLVIQGTQNFTGEVTKKFVVERKDISSAKIELIDELVYNGEEQQQKIRVLCGDLIATVDVSNNVGVEVGEYTLTASGNGNFSGSLSSVFAIRKRPIGETEAILEYQTCPYDGLAKTPKVTVVDRELGQLPGTEYEVAYLDNVDAGVGKVKVTGTHNYEGALDCEFQIANTVGSISGVQRLPWNEIVDVTYEVLGSESLTNSPVGVVATFEDSVITQMFSLGESSALGVAGVHKVALDLRSKIDKDEIVEISVFVGEFSSSPFVTNVKKSAYETRQIGEPLNLTYGADFAEGGETSQILVDGVLWYGSSEGGSIDWFSDQFGVHEFCHRVMKGGVVVGEEYVTTCEVWSASIVVHDVGRTLHELLPKTHGLVTSVTFAEGVTSIPAEFFDDCPNVQAVSLPSTIIEMGLDSLPELVRDSLEYDADGFLIFDGWLLDYEHRDATELTVPAGVVGIGQYALSDMELERLSLPSTLKSIASQGVSYQWALGELEVPDSVEYIGRGAFEGCSYMSSISFGTGLRVIDDGAFADCQALAPAVSLPIGLEKIGAMAFADCVRMMSVSLPISVTNVEFDAFTGCKNLTGVTTPTSIAPLSQWFSPIYTQIKDVTVPPGEGDVCSNMFKGCTSLVSVTLPNGITNISAGSFWNCSKLPSIVLPASLRSVGDDSFRNCDQLTGVGLPESVEFIGTRAFYDCYRLADVSLSKCLATIGDRAFDSCPSLDSIVIPAAVTNLGARVFGSAMRAVYYVGNAPWYDDDVYAATSGGLISYVQNDSKGWLGRDKPKSRGVPLDGWPVDNAYSRTITTWSPVQFDVTFDAGEGVFVPVESAQYACEQVMGTAYSLPPFNPARKGYKFAGWWTETVGGTQVTPSSGVSIDRAHTLYAHWAESAIVTVRFNACGGTVEPDEVEYTAEVPFGSFPVPTREHYIFVGWYTAASGGTLMRESAEVPRADRELFAHWTPAHYLIRFNANNGTGATVCQDYIYGQTVTLRANTFGCSGCQFTGWSLTPGGAAVYADGKTISELAAIEDGVMNLYAVWAGNVYAVRFDSHGGLGSMPNQTFVIGVAQPLSPCAFTRQGYVFKGWAESTTAAVKYGDGETVCDLTSRQSATIVLFAVWERDMSQEWMVEEYLNCTNLTFVLGGDEPHWYGLKNARSDKTGMMQSGAIGDSQTNWIETVVSGPGRIRFWWKASGEYETNKKGIITRYDYAEFVIDGEVVEEIGDESDWTEVVYEVTGTGTHTLRWMYHKDESGSDGEDCAWLSEVKWSPDLSAIDSIPELGLAASRTEIEAALNGTADHKLVENIIDVVTYSAYREWAMQIGAAEVKASPFAWVSFAVDSAALLEKQPTDDDLKIEEFTPSATAGSFDFTVSVRDVTIGDKASEDNLKKVFGLEGGETLVPSAFSADNVALDFKQPENGKLKFTATPAFDNAKSFFMKIKVK